MKSIIRKRSSVVCLHKGKFLAVILRDPQTEIANYFVPGGKIEEGESSEDAGIRETLEETGYQVNLVGEPIFRRYPFVWAKQNYDCHTWVYLGKLADYKQEKVNDAAYNLGAEWLDVNEIEKHLGLNEQILEPIQMLRKQAPQVFEA
jgi:8-oxo-dGTP pyrophosphatase MutT (NUDIX family)